MSRRERSEYLRNYRNNNKEHIKELLLKYREKKGDILRRKYMCDECNGKYTYEHKARHFKSKKHQKSLQEKMYEDLEKYEQHLYEKNNQDLENMNQDLYKHIEKEKFIQELNKKEKEMKEIFIEQKKQFKDEYYKLLPEFVYDENGKKYRYIRDCFNHKWSVQDAIWNEALGSLLIKN
jgi:hypothetical protein